MIGWLRRLFERDPHPHTNGRIERIEQEQARLVARLESLHISVDDPNGPVRQRFDRELRDLERGIGGRR